MFEITIEQSALANALKKVKNTVGKNEGDNTKMLYASCEVDNGTTVLKLITNNLSEVSEVVIPVIRGTVGKCSLLEYSKFASIIDTINDKLEIEIKMVNADATDLSVSLTYKGRKKPIIFNGIDLGAYIMPPLPTNTSIITLPFELLREGLNVASSVITDNDSCPKFNCTMIKIKNNTIEFTAIDSGIKRMLVFKKPVVAVDGEFFIECNKTRKMLAGFDTAKDVIINLSTNNIVFEQGNLKLTTRLTSGTFPDVASFIPSQYKVELEFDKMEMLQALSRINILTDDKSLTSSRSCVFHIDDIFTSLNLNSKYGNLAEMVICTLKGAPIVLAFSINAILTALNSFNEDKLRLCFINEKYGIITDSSSTHVHKCLIPSTLIHKEEV